MLFLVPPCQRAGGHRCDPSPGRARAINPMYALGLLCSQPVARLSGPGGNSLWITGGEALYADMGPAGAGDQWRGLAACFQALYLQLPRPGGALRRHQYLSAVKNPFYLLVPEPLLYPMVGLSTLATIITSQAVISRAFLHHQAGRPAGLLPAGACGAHLRAGGGADLRAQHQLDAAGGGGGAGHRVPVFSSALASATASR